ncbi:MAG TPA: cysteine hydrolase, partial [Acidimicrobiales bacterium]|nr:cysteine hydrolase [Acidimicrobiales bacterium]
YQEGICRPDGVFGSTGMGAEVERRDVLSVAASALHRFREKGYPVAHTKLEVDPRGHVLTSSSSQFIAVREHGLMCSGDPASDICPEVAPAPDERIIRKGGFGPFAGTSLEAYLHRVAPHELVMGGVSTNHVVESAVRYASDVGFPVIVLEDLCAASSPELHRFAVEEILPSFAEVMSCSKYFESW